MANFDNLKLSVEALSGGKNTVILDDLGIPSIMYVFNKIYLDDVISGAPHTAHPAFIVNGVEKSSINIAKYQSIVNNGRAYSLPYKDPAVSLNFDQALSYCYAKGNGWHMMSNAERAAIALWCKKNGFMPRGNNNYGCDVSASYERGKETFFDSGAGKTGRVATGSGPASWAHDNTNDGIFDLNGNVWEWCSGLRLNNGEIQVIQDNNAAMLNADHSSASALWKAIASADGSLVAPGTAGTLKYDNTTAGNSNTTSADIGGDPQLNTVINNTMYTPGGQVDYGYSNVNFENLTAASGITPPTILKALGLFPIDTSCGGDVLQVRNYAERLPFFGGSWFTGVSAGVFALYLSSARTYSNNNFGFRAAHVL